jgi:menaquinone-dependent protoporphyrinogen oxidase
MKTLIVYTTKYGSTKTCAEKIREKLNTDTVIVNLKNNKKPNVAEYDTVIIGGSIHAGRIQGQIKRFCSTQEKTLLEKKIGLFICCMYEGEQAQKQFEEAFPERLREHAAARGILGGILDFDKMNFVERMVVKKVAGVEESHFKLSEEKIDAFARELQN